VLKSLVMPRTSPYFVLMRRHSCTRSLKIDLLLHLFVAKDTISECYDKGNYVPHLHLDE
jgi:hypothetical protein